MPAPLVSVVLPVRNGGEWLADSVRSILDQSWSDLELLVVDDGSTDGAANSLPKSDPRLRLLESSSAGVAAAFNTGLSSSRGLFIARMDADDIALPERLEQQFAYLEEHPDIGIAGARVEIFSVQGVGEGNQRYQQWVNSLLTPDDIHRELFIESPIPNPTAMFRREVIERLGGYANDRPWPEDYDLFLRADAMGVRMGKPSACLLNWRDHPSRMTRTDPAFSLDAFARCKAHHLVSGRQPSRELVIWGAGPTGRDFCDALREEGKDVTAFLDIHPRRIGGQKRDRPVLSIEQVAQLSDAFVLVAVGAPGARQQIRAFMEQNGRRELEHYLFVA